MNVQTAIVPDRAPALAAAPTRLAGLRPLAVLSLVLVILLTTHSLGFLFAQVEMDGLVARATVRSSPVYGGLFAFTGGLVALLFVLTLLVDGVPRRLVLAGLVAALVLGSALWSVDVSRTVVNGTIFSFLVVAAYVVSVYLTPAQFLGVFYRTALVLTLASFVLLAVAPDLSRSLRFDAGWFGNDYEFRGVTGSKFRAGYLFVAVILILYLRPAGVRSRFTWPLWVALALGGIVLTNAATTVLALGFLAALAAWMKHVPAFRFPLAFAVAAVLLLVSVILPFIDFTGLDLFALIGREGTLTGRDQIWGLAIESFRDRPWLGHGYYAFFGTGPFSPAWQFWDHFMYFLTDAFHSSVMDLAVGLGVIGVAVYCAVTLAAAAVVFNRSLDVPVRILLGLVVILGLINSMTNFVVFSHIDPATFLVFYIFFVAGRDYRQPVSGHGTASGGRIPAAQPSYALGPSHAR